MESWLDLETRFKELEATSRQLSMQVQTTHYADKGRASETYFHTPMPHDVRILAMVAGKLLERSLRLEQEPGATLLRQKDREKRWYQALMELSGSYKPSFPAWGLDGSDNKTSTMISGDIRDVIHASASLCLQLHATYPARDPRSFWDKLYDDYGKEIVIGVIIGVFATLIAGVITAVAGIFG